MTDRGQSEGGAHRYPGSEGKRDGPGFLWERVLWESCAPVLPVFRQVSPPGKSTHQEIVSHSMGQGERRFLS